MLKTNWTVIILILPFLSSITSGLFSKFIGKKKCIQNSLFFISFNTILVVYFIFNTLLNEPAIYSLNLGSWITCDLVNIEWNFLFNRFNLIMLFVVNFVSMCVHFYSINYMENDPHLLRFLSYISLFTFFMVFLVTGNNFVILFIGWEGVGLCSYLLVNFWFTRVNANKSAMKALIVNRIGDFGLTLGLVLIFYTIKSLDFSLVFAMSPSLFFKTICIWNYKIYLGTVIGALLFTGAVGKSAQIGLHTWLPDAMEGPTPVSSLIHAATMVTAGVFLIIKCSPLFEYIPSMLLVMTLVGALTSFFSASIALVQNDIKKIIAYSTCSQLGYMIFSCGLSAYHISFFHLTNHAFFKALLFLTAGAIIHSLNNDQNLKKYGGVIYMLPLSSVTITIGSLALAGTPFLSGFYSKDAILEISFSFYNIASFYAYVFGLITALLTSIYSYRIFFATFISTSHFYKNSTSKIHESPFYMSFSLIVLSIGSLFSGYFFKDFFMGFGNEFWQNAIFVHFQNNKQFEAEFIPQIHKTLPFFMSVFFIGVINIFYNWNVFFYSSVFVKKLHKFLTYKWYFDAIYNYYVANILLKNAYSIFFKSIDKGILEVFGCTGIFLFVSKISFFTKKKFNSQLSDLLFFITICLCSILFATYMYI